MYKYVLKRIAMLIPVIIGVSLLIFCMMELAPGDVTDTIAADYNLEQIEALRKELNLDKSLIVRYLLYMKDLLSGNMGYSFVLESDVWKIYIQRLPYTLLLSFASVLVCVILSLPLGILSALKNGTPIDNICTVGALLGLSMPNFWLGLLLIILFSLKLGWLPSYGVNSGLIKSVILPAFTVGTGLMATMARTTRSSMLDVLRADYLRTARAKGVDEKVVINKHGLRNALIPIITIFGSQLGACLGGAVVTENVFSWPGVGQMLISGIKQRDTTLVCGFMIMTVIMVCIVQLLVDLAYAFVDPRLRSQYITGKKKKAGART